MDKRRETRVILAVMVVCCAVMGWIDAVLRPGYGMKSALKLLLFLGGPWLLYGRRHRGALKKLFRWDRRSWYALAAGLGVYGVILGGYFLAAQFFDFSQVVGALEQDVGVNAGNFVFVALYISFINSLLEEFFFRGFGYLALRDYLGENWASAWSALCFALYHVSMMLGWFHPGLLALLILGLAAAGWLFNCCDRVGGALWPSWFLHMFANFAINTVGFLLLGIL